MRIVCAVLMVLVPFSRMYLGVHTPLDVGVSFVLALALAAALYPAFRTEQTAKKATPWILLGAAALCGGYLLYASAQARGQRGSCQHHAWSQKRVHHDGRAARLSDRVFCR